ncbi:hypothetical protein GQ42DRAFT_181671, partial [Ramicandelaber brevisporus]
MFDWLRSLLVPKCSAADWSVWNDSGEPGFCTRHIGLGVLFSFSLLLLSLGFAVRTARREDAIAAKLAAMSPSDNSSNALARGYVGSRLEVLLDVLKVPFVAFLAVAHYALYQHIARSSTNHHRNPDHRDVWLATEAIQIAIWIVAFLAALIQVVRRVARSGVALGLQLAPLYLLSPLFVLPDVYHHFLKHDVPETLSLHDKIVVRRVARSGVALGLQLAPLYLLSPLFVLPDVYHHFLKHDVPETLSLHDKIVLSILAGSVALFTLTIFTDRSSRPVKSDDGFERSYETYCSIFSAATFNWVTPTVRLGNKKRLDPEDLDILPTGDQAKIAYDRFKAEEREDRSLFKNLFWHHRSLISWQFALVFICNICRFIGPLCLNVIVQYFENGMAGNKMGIYLWASGLFLAPMIASVTDQHQWWIGHRLSFRLRGIVSQMVIDKTLKLPVQAPTDHSNNVDSDKVDPDDEQSAVEGIADLRRNDAISGRVLTLLTSDLTDITDTGSYISQIYSSPMQIIMSFYLLYKLLGISVFIGVGFSMLLLVLSSSIVHKLFEFYELFHLQGDKRVSAINELFQSIRIVKMFAWSDRFIKKIDALREDQITTTKRMFPYELFNSVSLVTQPIVAMLLTFIFRTSTVLLDDCLSAVDSDTAKHIFKECILGPLMKDRTVVLVTHHVSLVLGAAAHVAVIHEGTVVAQGKPADVVARGYVKDVTETDLREARELAEKTSTSHNDHSVATATNVEQGKLVEEEEREVGSVGWAVYKAFGRACGGSLFWILLLFVTV